MGKHLPLIMLAATIALPGAANSEDLLEIYQQALRSDPLLREAEANRLATREGQPQAIGALLPQLDANANFRDSESDGVITTQFRAETALRTFDDEEDGWSWDVTLRQTLFRWDQFAELKKASREVAQAEVDYAAAEQDLITRVATAYFNVLAAQDTLASEQAAKEAIGRQLEQAQKRFEVGLIAITDVQEAQAGFDEAVAAEIVAKRSLANQRELLREVTGQYTEELATPRVGFPLLAPVPEIESEWVEQAKMQNPELLSAELGAEIAKREVDIARSGHLPTVDLVATYTEQDVTGSSTTPDMMGVLNTAPTGRDISDTTLSVQFAVPLFAGGATKSRVKQAAYRSRAARETLERVVRETERETRDAYLGVISEISRVKALKQALESARTALQATEAGFEVGTRTTVDVLDARRALFLAETNYARSRYDYIINVLLLKQAAGTLSEADLVEVNGWLTEVAQPDAEAGNSG